MEYGNYGYTDELSGAWWGQWRINREDSVPFRHWHQDDPGVVPNLLLNGAGSPSGACVYEGRSEEHTSELQSLMRISYAVFCLKKKKKQKIRYYSKNS